MPKGGKIQGLEERTLLMPHLHDVLNCRKGVISIRFILITHIISWKPGSKEVNTSRDPKLYKTWSTGSIQNEMINIGGAGRYVYLSS